jgi:hypothetical protein
VTAPRWGEPGWMPQLGPERIHLESHRALYRIAAGLIDETGRQRPEGPRMRLSDLDVAMLAHDASMGCPAPEH